MDCQSVESTLFWYAGDNNNAPISKFVVYYRDWSPDAARSPPFNRSALTIGANVSVRAGYTFASLTHSILTTSFPRGPGLAVSRLACASACVVECRICNREVVGSYLGRGLLHTKVYSAFHPSGVGK